jgi:hypothetical protein
METNLIHQLTETFEGHGQQTETGVEYWLARDLQQLLGYSKWENFQAVIAKAKTACEVSGHSVGNHFPDVRKMVRIGSGTEREIDDARTHGMSIEPEISREHVTNNQAVRETLLSRGIRPESLPAAEDIKKVERRLTSDEKKALKNPDTLEGE